MRVQTNQNDQIGQHRQLEGEPEQSQHGQWDEQKMNCGRHDDQERPPEIHVVQEAAQEEVVQRDVELQPNRASPESLQQFPKVVDDQLGRLHKVCSRVAKVQHRRQDHHAKANVEQECPFGPANKNPQINNLLLKKKTKQNLSPFFRLTLSNR
uniref:(northern house mosquito) hypothetical protein n=1 Tax=Culex pipiens TaxID=7175 RepID=A0A8D8EXK7_CULPI